MPSCEKCWRDAGGDAHEYAKLIAERKDNPCTPEQQAGEYAEDCPKCQRRTIHQHTHRCVVCGGEKRDTSGERELVRFVMRIQAALMKKYDMPTECGPYFEITTKGITVSDEEGFMQIEDASAVQALQEIGVVE